MKRLFVAGAALVTLFGFPTAGAAQKPANDRERIHTTITTPVDKTLETCLGTIRITGTLETTTRAGGPVEGEEGQVHSVISSRLKDASAVNVATGQQYKVQEVEHSHRAYEAGGTSRHVAGTTSRLRISAPGSGDSFFVTGRWQYRQDQAGNVVLNELELDGGCK